MTKKQIAETQPLTVANESPLPQTISFSNDGEPIVLKLLSDSVSELGYAVYSDQQDHRFGLSQQLIWVSSGVAIPGSEALSTESEGRSQPRKTRHGQTITNRQNELFSQAGVIESQLIAQLSDKTIYLLTLEHWQLPRAMTLLAELEETIIVQPDLLQLESSDKNLDRTLPEQGNAKDEAIALEAEQLKRLDSSNLPAAIKALIEPHLLAPHLQSDDNSLKVAIIDDGFDLQHEAFDDIRVLLEYDVGHKVMNATPKSALDFHGTAITGVIAGQLEQQIPVLNSKVIAIRMSQTWTSGVILAFTVSQKMQANVINASWTLRLLPQPLRMTIESVLQHSHWSPLLVAAAGNSGLNACQDNALSLIDQVIVIGSTDHNGDIAGYSNYGPCVDYYVQGRHLSVALNKERGTGLYVGTSLSAAFFSRQLLRELSKLRKYP